MKLGWIDKVEKRTTYYLPAIDSRKDLFCRESRQAYINRFFAEIRGLGNVVLVKDGRVIASR